MRLNNRNPYAYKFINLVKKYGYDAFTGLEHSNDTYYYMNRNSFIEFIVEYLNEINLATTVKLPLNDYCVPISNYHNFFLLELKNVLYAYYLYISDISNKVKDNLFIHKQIHNQLVKTYKLVNSFNLKELDMELRTKIKSKLDLNYLNQYNNETNETNEMNTNNIKFVENEGNCLIDLIVYATKNKLQILFSNEKEVNIKLIIHDPDHNCKVLEWFIQLIEFQNSFYTNIYEDDTNEIVSEINRYIEKRNKRLDIIDKAKLAISKLTSEELDYIMEYKELIKEHPEYIY